MIDIKAIRLRASKADETIWITSVESNATVLALCDEVERLRKDVARWKFVQENLNHLPYDDYGCGPEFDLSDAAIDASIEAKT